MITLCCLDMAGTTVLDERAVESAFAAALDRVGVAKDSPERGRMERYVAETMGTSKIEVFRALLGDELADDANLAFEEVYGEFVAGGGARPVPGAEGVITGLREAGVKVALHTGFSAVTRDKLLAALGWQEIADLTLCPAEAGRGRPYPDMILTSILRLRIDGVASVAVCGDTAADVVAGLRAGAPVVAAVLTGADGRERLKEAGATHVIDSVVDLPGLLRLDAVT